MEPILLHEGKFSRIRWDEQTRIIGIEWKEATSSMMDEDFKADLILFAGHVETKKAPLIFVDIRNFHHKLGEQIAPCRVKNISSRYNAAGVKREAFLLPQDAPIAPGMFQSVAGED